MIGMAGAVLAGLLAVEGPPESKFPAWNDLGPRGFAQEVLFGYGMQRTPRFDDYTDGSYHVEPANLAAVLPKEAAIYQLDLQALVIVGPYGPLWEYDVIALLQEKECIRVNWLGMPHARITVKKSACLPKASVETFLRQARVLTAAPVDPAKAPVDSCLLLAEYGSATSVRTMPADCYAASLPGSFDAFESAMNELYERLELTYSGYDPEVEE